jgi:hypothetical protein
VLPSVMRITLSMQGIRPCRPRATPGDAPCKPIAYEGYTSF